MWSGGPVWVQARPDTRARALGQVPALQDLGSSPDKTRLTGSSRGGASSSPQGLCTSEFPSGGSFADLT